MGEMGERSAEKDQVCAKARRVLLPEVFAAEHDRHCESHNPLSARDRLNLELIAQQGRTLGERPWRESGGNDA